MNAGAVATPRAEEYLPEEMWTMIFGYVNKEEDIWRCYNTCTLFQKLLKLKVFAQALAIVQRQVSGTKLMLTERDVLSCRLVSRDSKKMTDHYLRSRASRLDLSCYRTISLGFQHSFHDQIINTPNKFGSICLQISKLKEADSLVTQITSNLRVKKGANMLVGRHIIIVGHRGSQFRKEDSRNPAKQRFYDIVYRLLTACGQHVWYLSVCDSVSDGLPQLIFNTCWKWLELVPHVKMFTCLITVGRMTTQKQAEVQKELRDHITQQPFPRLPHLVTLQLSGLPDVVLHSAMEVNPSVQKLEVVPFRYEVELPTNISQWNNLRLTEFCFINCKMEKLRQITEMGCPLEKLSIRSDSFLMAQQRDVELYLQQLGNYGATLKYLRLEFPCRSPHVEEAQWQLQLPHLEELILDVMHRAKLDFMTPLKSLRKLKLSVVEVEMEPHVMFKGSMAPISSLYESYMWDELPALREVEVQMFKYLTKTFVQFKYKRSQRPEHMSEKVQSELSRNKRKRLNGNESLN